MPPTSGFINVLKMFVQHYKLYASVYYDMTQKDCDKYDA